MSILRRCSVRASLALAISIGLACWLLPATAVACPNCSAGQVARSQVWQDQFGFNLATALFPFLVLGAVSVRAERSFGASRAGAVSHAAIGAVTRGPLISAGLLLGTGLGGFVDGILLHQLLQWHNMLSSVRPPTDLVAMKYNMLWDGLFHAFTWLMTALGIGRLWTAGKRSDVPWSTATLLGSLLLGWGAFNFIEGLIDHQLLGIHHVHPGEGQLAWDLGFLVFGVVQCAGGWFLLRAGARDGAARGDAPAS